MGVDWYARAAIGCKVAKEKLWPTSRVRACSHPLPDEAMRFCPTCGKPAWENRSRPADGYDEGKGTFHGFPVARGTDGAVHVVCVKGCLAEADSDDGAARRGLPGDIGEAEHDLRAMLEPLGMWDDKAFGLWSILYCSY